MNLMLKLFIKSFIPMLITWSYIPKSRTVMRHPHHYAVSGTIKDGTFAIEVKILHFLYSCFSYFGFEIK